MREGMFFFFVQTYISLKDRGQMGIRLEGEGCFFRLFVQIFVENFLFFLCFYFTRTKGKEMREHTHTNTHTGGNDSRGMRRRIAATLLTHGTCVESVFKMKNHIVRYEMEKKIKTIEGNQDGMI